MSEIKTNSIKPALNPTKVRFKTGISVVDPNAPSNSNKSFEVNTQGQIEINTPLTVGTLAGATTGSIGQVLLSRGVKYPPIWGPIPSVSCPSIPDTGSIWSRTLSNLSDECGANLGCGNNNGNNSTTAVYEGVPVSSPLYPLTWKIVVSDQLNTGAGITVDGALYTWGSANSGRIGDGRSFNTFGCGTNMATNCPYRVGTQNNWNSVLTNQSWTLATKTDGTMWVWGSNHSCVYGNCTASNPVLDYDIFASTFYYRNPYNSGNSIIPSVEPVRMGTDTDWECVFPGSHESPYGIVIALKKNGTLWSWGGQGRSGLTTANLGYTPPPSVFPNYGRQGTPKQIGTDTDWKWATHSNNLLSYGIKTDGSLWVWGSNKNHMGLGTYQSGTIPQHTPIKISGPGYAAAGPVAGNAKWKKVVTDGSSSAGLQEDGSVWVWGSNPFGMVLGLGKTNPITNNAFTSTTTSAGFVLYPVRLDNNTYVDITVGNWSFAGFGAIRSDGTLWIFGYIGVTFNTSTNTHTANEFADNVAATPPYGDSTRPALYIPYQPNWSKNLIWNRFSGTIHAYGGSLGWQIAALATEKVLAPQGTTARWFRKGYTSLSNSCNSGAATANSSVPGPPAGWVYCDGQNGTVNLKTWPNPLTGKLDWPPLDNTNGCGDSIGSLSGQLTYIQKS